MEPLSILAGAGAVAVGVLIGRAMRPRPTPDPGPVCSCEHGYGQHENGGKCMAETERTIYGGGYAVRGTEWVRCPCLKHDGPVPLPEVWAP